MLAQLSPMGVRRGGGIRPWYFNMGNYIGGVDERYADDGPLWQLDKTTSFLHLSEGWTLAP